MLVVAGISSLFNSRESFIPDPAAEEAAQAVSNPSRQGGTFQKVPNQVLFALDGDGKPNISGNLSNIAQGGTGDCYFPAALLTVAARAPDTILNMVDDNGDGTCTVSFHSKYDGAPHPVKVTVNGDLPYRRGTP